MRVLIFCQYYYPERFLINQIAERLVLEGHEVSVITALPNYGFPKGRVLDEYKSGKNEEVINGVRVYRCKVAGRGESKFTLLKNYFSYMMKATLQSKKIKENFDVVFCYQLTPVLQLYPAIKYAKKHGLKLLCYCLDLAPESGIRLLRKVPLAKRAYCSFSKWAYKQCTTIAVTSKHFTEYLNQVNEIEKKKIIYLPQHGPENLLTCNCEKKHEGMINFMFAGNLGTGANVSTIIYAVKELLNNETRQFRMVFVGSGSMKSELEKLVHEESLDPWIFFRDPVPPDKMPAVYSEADALVLSLRKGQITVPGKLQAYMATGKPVLGAMDGSGRDVIIESKCGMCVAADDVKGLARAFKEYMNDPASFDELGRNGREYFQKHFTLDIFTMGLEKILFNEAEK